MPSIKTSRRSVISSNSNSSNSNYHNSKAFNRIRWTAWTFTNNNKIDILLEIIQVSPKYTKQINIIGNSRTIDYVIRRELEIVEGDAIYENQINTLKEQLKSLSLFETVNIKEEKIDNETINLIIEVEEKNLKFHSRHSAKERIYIYNIII